MVESPRREQPLDIVFNINALVIAFLILVPLERVFGLHAGQKALRLGLAGDVIYGWFAGRLSFLNALFRVSDHHRTDLPERHSVQRMNQRFISTVKPR